MGSDPGRPMTHFETDPAAIERTVGSDPSPPPARKARVIGVLISGRGSNLQALIDAIAEHRLDARIGVVISNRADAGGIQRARAAGIETIIVDHRDFASRDDFDRELVRALQARGVALVCLAGFMRLVGAPLLEAFPNRILNVHPSLLPAFPGVNAQGQALDHGVKIAGATVHLVTGELDGGPIVLQAAVPVRADDTVETLSARILIEEHRIYPDAVGLILDGGWIVQGRRFSRPASSHHRPGTSL
jgi:phosphoribosylglycinamide formyltransferase-1